MDHMYKHMIYLSADKADHHDCYLPVGEGRDYQSRGVPKVFVGVQKLCITDVSKAMFFTLIPSVMKDDSYQ